MNAGGRHPGALEHGSCTSGDTRKQKALHPSPLREINHLGGACALGLTEKCCPATRTREGNVIDRGSACTECTRATSDPTPLIRRRQEAARRGPSHLRSWARPAAAARGA